jgi:hypothetical protein
MIGASQVPPIPPASVIIGDYRETLSATPCRARKRKRPGIGRIPFHRDRLTTTGRERMIGGKVRRVYQCTPRDNVGDSLRCLHNTLHD